VWVTRIVRSALTVVGIIPQTGVTQQDPMRGYADFMTRRRVNSAEHGPADRQRRLRRVRLRLVISLAVLVPTGFAMKLYDGPDRWQGFERWLNNSAGGAAYVIFFCLLFALFRPRRRAIPAIVITVFAVTGALEAMQLWKPAFLQSIRSTFIGRTLIGTTFTPSDYIYYVIGAALGWLWLRFVTR